MELDPLLLQRALELSSSAIDYHVGREIEAWARPRAVVALPGNEIDTRDFARAGRCDATPRDDIHSQVGLIWARRGVVDEHDGNVWLRVRWSGHDLDVVSLTWDRGYSRTTATWVVADDTAIARAFALDLAEFCALPPNAALVFSSGCWSHESDAWSAIRKARAEDLIVPAGFLERIFADARQFVSGRATYARYGLPYKRGLLFAGPPGNGKTACLRVLLRDLELPVLVVRSFTSRYGEVEQNVRSAFAKAKRASPCALVLEDLDVLARGAALPALLNEMDGLGAETGILTLATSNHPELLDPALIDRPSRFDRVYRFTLPDSDARRRYLAMWNRRVEEPLRLDDDVVEDLTSRTEGFSFAFLQELVMSATLRWVADEGRLPIRELLHGELQALRDQRAAPAPAPQRHAGEVES